MTVPLHPESRSRIRGKLSPPYLYVFMALCLSTLSEAAGLNIKCYFLLNSILLVYSGTSQGLDWTETTSCQLYTCPGQRNAHEAFVVCRMTDG